MQSHEGQQRYMGGRELNESNQTSRLSRPLFEEGHENLRAEESQQSANDSSISWIAWTITDNPPNPPSLLPISVSRYIP